MAEIRGVRKRLRAVEDSARDSNNLFNQTLQEITAGAQRQVRVKLESAAATTKLSEDLQGITERWKPYANPEKTKTDEPKDESPLS